MRNWSFSEIIGLATIWIVMCLASILVICIGSWLVSLAFFVPGIKILIASLFTGTLLTYLAVKYMPGPQG